jgi:hypothetical protein
MTIPVSERYRRWVAAVIPARSLIALRIAFGLVWLAYDLSDLYLRGTADESGALYGYHAGPLSLAALQWSLVACELALVVGWPARLAALVAAGLRALEAWHYLRVNDFYAYSVLALLLAQCRCGGSPFGPAPRALVPAWPRDLFIWQVAWVYVATGVLKLSPAWLSGEHLWVRHHFLEAAGWPYPGFVRACVLNVRCDAALAWGGALGELTMGVLLFTRRARLAAVGLAIALHTYAALALNVWFFGFTMVALVATLLGLYEPARPPPADTPPATPPPPASDQTSG